MKRLAFYFYLFLITAVAQAQVSPTDSFSVKEALIPTSLTADTASGLRDTSLTKLDTQNLQAAQESSAAKPIEVTVIDTIKVLVYDTVKAKESLTESADSVAEKTVNKAKDEIKDLGKKATEKIPSLNEVINFGNIFWSLVILVIAYFLIKLLVVIIERFAEKSTTYRIGLKGISPFVRIIGWTVAIIWVVEGIFKPPHAAILTFLASAGIAIGFAAQDILKNIFGGIMILFDRPFQVGDKIEVGSYYGEVTEIGLRSTRIVTKDDSLVSIPNAEVVNSSVSNSNTGEANCQVVAEIYLPIDADTNLARVVAIEAAQVSRFIYLNKPITVLFFNDVQQHRSFLKMRLKAYVSDIRNEFAFQSDMTEIVVKELIKKGVIKKNEIM